MKKINFKNLLLVLVVVIVLVPFSTVLAGERTETLKKACEGLKNKAKEVYATIEDFRERGSSFDEQCKAAFEDLKKNPNSLKRQLDVCNILNAQADKLQESLNIADKADLGVLRDNVAQGFQTVSELKAAEAQKYQNRANSVQGADKVRYEQLSIACLNFSKGYGLQAQKYRKIPIDEQMLEVKASLEYLGCVKEVLAGLKEFIETIRVDEETLRQLLDAQKLLVSLQKSILTFSEVVLDGALNDSFHVGEDLSDVSKKQG